jgi:hypothetical protein
LQAIFRFLLCTAIVATRCCIVNDNPPQCSHGDRQQADLPLWLPLCDNVHERSMTIPPTSYWDNHWRIAINFVDILQCILDHADIQLHWAWESTSKSARTVIIGNAVGTFYIWDNIRYNLLRLLRARDWHKVHEMTIGRWLFHLRQTNVKCRQLSITGTDPM